MLELPEEVKRLQDEKLLNLDDEGTSVNVVVIRGLNAVPFSHKPAAPPVNIPMGRPVSSAVDAGKPASEAASSVSSASEMRAAAIGRAPSAAEEATMKNVLGMLQPSGTSTPQEDDEADAEMQMKALERVAEHLPPVSTANAAELAAALLMTGPELRLFFDSKTDMMGRCGRTELEEFLLEVTKTKAVVPQAQRLISVRCFVGEICNRAKREALLGGARDGVSMHRLLASRAQGARAGCALCAGGEEEVCRVACLLAARHTCGPSASPSAPIGPRALYDRQSSGGSCAQLKPQLKPQQLSRTRDGGGSRDRTTIPTRRVLSRPPPNGQCAPRRSDLVGMADGQRAPSYG